MVLMQNSVNGVMTILYGVGKPALASKNLNCWNKIFGEDYMKRRKYDKVLSYSIESLLWEKEIEVFYQVII